MSLLAPRIQHRLRSSRQSTRTVVCLGVLAGTLMLASSQPASAGIVPTVSLATAANYSVLGATTVTNTNPSVIGQSVGLAPGSSITGFPPGIVLAPATIQAANAVTLQAQLDLTTAYLDAAGRPTEFPDTNPDLVGLTLAPGVYAAASKAPLGLSGQLVLDGLGDPDAVFIFQTDSTLITSTGSTIALINGASECNVFWQVGSSATLGSGSLFVGNILALTAVTVGSGTVVHGRALARNAAVTLDDDVFTAPSCVPSNDVVPTATAPSTTTTTTAITTTAAPVTLAPATTTPASTVAAPEPSLFSTSTATSPTTASPSVASTQPVTSSPSGNEVGSTVPRRVDRTTTTGPSTVTDITMPPTGSSTRTTSIAASSLVFAGLAAMLIARRRTHV